MNAVAAGLRAQSKDYFDLTKPRITLLVLVTAFTGMWLAAGGLPPLDLAFWTLLGTALAASSSSVLNNVVDRHVDGLMSRTRERALPSGRVRAPHAVAWGVLLGLSAFALLVATVNALAAWLAVGTIAFYVGIYTIWLKRATPLCTSIGGIAGAAPPLIGWAGVTGEVGPPALALFLILFLWQPPHFWALALLRADEYRRAKLPMLPVARGERVTKRQMLLYTVALLPASVVPYAWGWMGNFYLAVALALGGGYLALTVDFARRPITARSARRLFGFSILYLFVLFVMMFVDCRCAEALGLP